MRAAFLVGVRQFELREVPDPVVPEDGLMLRVEACGVCGSDLRRWQEGLPSGVTAITPGHEIAGVVVAVGHKINQYAPGDRLAVAPDVHCGRCYYCQRGVYNLCEDLRFIGITPGYPGGFADQVVLTDEILVNGIVHPMPAGVSFPAGALAETLSSVLAAHQKAGTSLADTVVVMGAGPVGCLHVAVAKARGARVLISEPNETRREIARQFGPDALVDPLNEDLGGRVRQLTDGRGADIVICANPVAATQAQAVEVVRKAGRVVFFGGLPKAKPMTSLDANRIHYGEIEVVGAFSYHPTLHALALDVLSRQLIPTERIITHTFPLEKIGEAFEVAASGAGLKVIVAPHSRTAEGQ